MSEPSTDKSKQSGTMKVQSLIFSKDKFDREKAKKWASDHNFKSSDVDETGESFRLRQKDPGQFKTMRTITMTEGVKAVVAKSTGKKLFATPSLILKMVTPSDSPQSLVDRINSSTGTIGGTVRDGSDSEKFNVGSLVFDVNRAKELSNGKANDEIEASPHWSDRIFVDEKAAMGSTSNNPVLVAQIPTRAGIVPLLIDDHHRMHKAVQEGKDKLPAFVLSPDQSVDLIQTHPDILNCLRSNLHEDSNPVMKAFKSLSQKFDKVIKSLGPTRSDVHVNAPLGSDDEQGIFKAAGLSEEAKEKSAGLVTFPEDVKGSNCSNCKYVNGNHCDNPKLDIELKDGPDHMCCNLWDHEGTKGFVSKTVDDDDEIFYPLNNTEVGAGDFSNEEEEDNVVKSAFEPNDDMGIHSMQELVSGMDHELEDGTLDMDSAKEKALAHLSDDPDYYKKIRMAHMGETFGRIGKDATKLQDGVHVHLGSNGDRKKHHIGYDVVGEDYGTVVHDLNLPVPMADGTASSVSVTKSMNDLSENPKALMSEAVRLLMPGGQFVVEGPNEVYNYPAELVSHGEPEVIDKDAGTVRREFTKVVPDAATANDADVRVGVPTFDQMSTDELMAMDAAGYYFSDATTSGRGNRLHGYPSQGAATKPKDDLNELNKAELKTRNEEKVKKILKSADVVPIFKADKMKQVLYCVVYEPNEVDTQDEWMPAEEIEKAAHFYLVNSRVVGKNHNSVIKAEVVESFIAPQDLEYKGGANGDQVVRKGSWVIGIKINDPAEWQKVLNGDYTGVSVGGFGVRD